MKKIILLYLLLILVISIQVSNASKITLQALAEDGHPVDTLFVGIPGYMYLMLELEDPDSVEAVVLSFSMSNAVGADLIIDPILESDWEWMNSFNQFDTNGFNESYQDGISPDTGVMFAINFQELPALPSETIIARFKVTPISEGILLFDTLTVLNGIVQNISSLILTQSDYIDVEGELEFEFNPLVIVNCPTVSVECYTTIDTILAEPSNFCMPMTIEGAYSIDVTGATLQNEILCIQIDTTGSYEIEIIGSNACSSDTCFFLINARIGCCLDIRGNIDGSLDDSIDIADLVFLVAYMFLEGIESPCFEEADFDGSTEIDISDLVGLVTYMFSGGAAPVACP